ncbi:MAG: hypothetical protein QOF30_454 [Acidimicrobiaceae bacterium]|nr:hypothetical protein [Acidimicrobiaceae bacterium]
MPQLFASMVPSLTILLRHVTCLIMSRWRRLQRGKGRCGPSSISGGSAVGLSVHEALGLRRTRVSNLGDPNVGMIDCQ